MGIRRKVADAGDVLGHVSVVPKRMCPLGRSQLAMAVAWRQARAARARAGGLVSPCTAADPHQGMPTLHHPHPQAMAKEKGNPGVEGEVFKWMGHTHNKLAERDRARELFTQGAAFAKVRPGPVRLRGGG